MLFCPGAIPEVLNRGSLEYMFKGFFMKLAVLPDIEPGEVEAKALYLPLNGEEDFFCDAIGSDIEEALAEQSEVGLEIMGRGICNEGIFVVPCEGIFQF